MSAEPDLLEAFWNDLLSREPARIQAACGPLDGPTRAAVLTHLRRMLLEDGWQPGQRSSARAALAVLESAAGREDLPHQIEDSA